MSLLIIYCYLITSVFAKGSQRIENILSISFEDGDILLHEGLVQQWVAKGNFTDNTFADGWSYLEIESRSSFPDLIQSYAAGYVEGAASSSIIYNSWRNTQEGFCKMYGEEFCQNLRNFTEKNISWMKYEIRQQRDTSPIWHHVELVLSQLQGLSDGYNAVANVSISMEDILWMNLSGDMEDLENALKPERWNMTFEEWLDSRDFMSDGRCSALIKVLPDNADLYVSHVTWNNYQAMLRVLKKYVLPFRFTAASNSSEIIPGYMATFSSYPAYLHSGDDFYTLSSGLSTLETTIGNSNPALWRNVHPEGELQEWIRVIVANRIATTGAEWTNIFKQYNSGTYNNQWMVVDYKQFKVGKPIKPRTLFVLEQLPGFVKYADRSDVLSAQSYWPSYNIPSFPEVFALSGGPALVEKYGDWFSYDKSPRALIFARNNSFVVDMTSMMALMRYNDYESDPLSRCNCTPPFSAENAISARSDLNPANGTYPFGALGHRSHGGTDAKLTNSSLFRKARFWAVAGPTYDQQPVFMWSEQDFAPTTPHYGHPDAWQFAPVYHKWIW